MQYLRPSAKQAFKTAAYNNQLTKNTLLRASQQATAVNNTQRSFFNLNRVQGVQKSARFVTVTAKRSFSNLPDHLKLEMPNLSPTMEKGNIQKWLKNVGDEVQPGDALASIETDKAVVDFEMQEEGFVAKLLYPEGAKDVPLGKIVAILVDSKDDIAAFANYDEGSADSTPAAEPTSAPA